MTGRRCAAFRFKCLVDRSCLIGYGRYYEDSWLSTRTWWPASTPSQYVPPFLYLPTIAHHLLLDKGSAFFSSTETSHSRAEELRPQIKLWDAERPPVGGLYIITEVDTKHNGRVIVYFSLRMDRMGIRYLTTV